MSCSSNQLEEENAPDQDKPDDYSLCDTYAARRFLTARKRLGLTQVQLIELMSAHLGKSQDPKTLYRWEHALTPVPSFLVFWLEMIGERIKLMKMNKLNHLNRRQLENVLKEVQSEMQQYIKD